MKTRSGFVSNSSSSSFIIGFNKDPMNKDNLAEEMGDCETIFNEWSHGRVYSAEEIVEKLHEKLLRVGPATSSELLKELRSMIPWSAYENATGYPVFEEYDLRDPVQEAEYYRLSDEWTDQYLASDPRTQAIRNSLENKHVYIVEYDDDGPDAVFETGKPFKNLNATKVSHH